jgi:hypothetical protein
MQLSRYADLKVCALTTAASIAAEIDCQDCEGVLFVGVPGTTLARTWSLALKTGDSTSAFVNCSSTFTHTSSGAANHVITTDVYKPPKRWVGATFSCTTATPCYLLALKYGQRKNTTGTFSCTGGFVSAVTGGILRAVSPSSAT